MLPKDLALDGLTADVPRAARFTSRTQALRLLSLLAAVAALGLLGWLASQDLSELNALAAHGQTAVARITGKHDSGTVKSRTYYIDYTFNADGTPVDDEYEVGHAEYERPLSRATLLVTFLPSDPLTHRLGAVTRERTLNKAVLWILRGLGACVLLGGVLTIRESSLRRKLALLRDGSLAAGKITYCHKSGREGFFISYEFTVEGWLSPKKITRDLNSRGRVEVGSTLAILYDPSRPSRSVPYRTLTDVVLYER